MTNLPFESNRTKSKADNRIVHTYLNGPHHDTGYKGENYFLTLIHDYSKCARVYCLKNKSETVGIFCTSIKRLKCDKGTEHVNGEIFEFASQKGIEILSCPTNFHEFNGVVERYNRLAMDIARCPQKEAVVNKIYWPEVISTFSDLF